MPLLIRTANIAPVISPLSSTSAILINDILIPVLDASSFNAHHLTFDWKRVYLLSFCTALETKV